MKEPDDDQKEGNFRTRPIYTVPVDNLTYSVCILRGLRHLVFLRRAFLPRDCGCVARIGAPPMAGSVRYFWFAEVPREAVEFLRSVRGPCHRGNWDAYLRSPCPQRHQARQRPISGAHVTGRHLLIFASCEMTLVMERSSRTSAAIVTVGSMPFQVFGLVPSMESVVLQLQGATILRGISGWY